MTPSSTFRPKLSDPEYMELVFEDGQILAKGLRSNVSQQNQRTISIMDLYEAEYNEDFKKSTIHGCCGGSIKNLEGRKVVQEHDVVAYTDATDMLKSNKHVFEYDYPKNIDFIPPDEQSVVAEWSVESGFETSFTDFAEDSEGSSYLSSSPDNDVVTPRAPARTKKALIKRKRSKQSKDINKKMRTLQDLLPNFHKDDSESMLNEAINYMTTLQYQIQMMTMGNRFVTPSMMLPMGPDYSHKGLTTCMQMCVPQFMPAPVPGPALPGNCDATNML